MKENSARCERCMKQIALKRDSYFKIETYLHGNLVRIGYLHKSCNDEAESMKRKTEKIVLDTAQKIPALMKSLGIETREIVEIGGKE